MGSLTSSIGIFFKLKLACSIIATICQNSQILKYAVSQAWYMPLYSSKPNNCALKIQIELHKYKKRSWMFKIDSNKAARSKYIYATTTAKKNTHILKEKDCRATAEAVTSKRLPLPEVGLFQCKLNRHICRYMRCICIYWYTCMYIFVGRRNNISRFIVTSDKICWVCDDLFNKNETFNSIPFRSVHQLKQCNTHTL